MLPSRSQNNAHSAGRWNGKSTHAIASRAADRTGCCAGYAPCRHDQPTAQSQEHGQAGRAVFHENFEVVVVGVVHVTGEARGVRAVHVEPLHLP